ncbi:MAG: M23 family metallopeptidase [Comamonadaceae bacterium]|nr:MAG: M23 family metallopeptidase [Comamonadaceae bacterium]
MNTAVDALLSRLAGGIQKHPKRITAAVAALLLCGAGGAFAVASLAPDASDLPVHEFVESVQTLPLAAQSELLAGHSFNLFRSETTRSSDTAETLLKRMGIDDAAAAAFLRNDPNARSGLLGRAGRAVSAEATDAHELQRLSVRWNPEDDGSFKRLVIEKSGKAFVSRIENAPLTASTRLAGGVIRSSLFAATDEARIPDAVAVQVVEMFSGDIDFHRALRKGDRFSIVYETLEADGEPLRTGRVLSAEFVNDGKSYSAMWFQEPGAKGGYYTLDGKSMRRAYLTSPVEFSRVTSGFSMRFHPILQKWRAHLGVDYAAPTGTGVRSVGDGVVDFAGVQNGFGNVVFVKHASGHTTVYAHLSRIAVARGQKVSQGQSLGAVGSTGWATGPHLHFEFRVNGMHQDPMTIARQSESIPVSVAARPVFDRMAASFRVQLSSAASLLQASAQ